MVWVENPLVRDGTFRLPGKNCLIAGGKGVSSPVVA
jgi:hypothetical protein